MEITIHIDYEVALEACLKYAETRRNAIAGIIQNGSLGKPTKELAGFSSTELSRLQKAGWRNVRDYYSRAAESLQELLDSEPSRKAVTDCLED